MTYTIDWEKLDELLMAGCLGTEIAGYFGMHPDTLYRKVLEEKNVGFHDYLANKRRKGESILRSHQYAKALGDSEKGDNTLLIWLGKTRLGQKEMDYAPVNSPNQNDLDKDQLIMQQAHRIAELEANVNKPQTE